MDKANVQVALEGTLSIEIGGQVTEVKLSQKQESTTTTYDANPLKK